MACCLVVKALEVEYLKKLNRILWSLNFLDQANPLDTVSLVDAAVCREQQALGQRPSQDAAWRSTAIDMHT